MGNTYGVASEEPDLKFREDPLVYFCTIYRPMGNELGEQTRRGDEDTYGHSETDQRRKVPWRKKCASRNISKYQTRNYRCVNSCDDLEGECDGGNDLDGDSDAANYQGGHHLNQINLGGGNSLQSG